jgi:hypothetical protein
VKACLSAFQEFALPVTAHQAQSSSHTDLLIASFEVCKGTRSSRPAKFGTPASIQSVAIHQDVQARWKVY